MSARAGFTMLELLVVLALLSMTLVLVMPSLGSMARSETQQELQRLGRVIRMVRNEAVLAGRRHHIAFDLVNNRYAISYEDAEMGFINYERPRSLQPHQLPDSLRLAELQPAGTGSAPIRDRAVEILVDHSGFMDPFTLLLREDKTLHAIRVAGLSGRIDMASGDEFNPPEFPEARR